MIKLNLIIAFFMGLLIMPSGAFAQVCGDANGDGSINVSDGVSIINYLFVDDEAQLENADVDNCGTINIFDAYYWWHLMLFGNSKLCHGDYVCDPPEGKFRADMGGPVETSGFTGDSVAISLYITSDSILEAFTLGFALSSSDVYATSVEVNDTFSKRYGSRPPYYKKPLNKFYVYGVNSQRYHLTSLDSVHLKIWIQIPKGTPAQVIDLDSCSDFSPGSNIDFIFATHHRAFTPDYIDHGPELIITYPDYICGDANGDGMLSLSDCVWMMDFFFLHGPDPVYYLSGDLNCDQDLSVSDLIWLINYLWWSGSAPCDIDADGSPDC